MHMVHALIIAGGWGGGMFTRPGRRVFIMESVIIIVTAFCCWACFMDMGCTIIIMGAVLMIMVSVIIMAGERQHNDGRHDRNYDWRAFDHQYGGLGRTVGDPTILLKHQSPLLQEPETASWQELSRKKPHRSRAAP